MNNANERALAVQPDMTGRRSSLGSTGRRPTQDGSGPVRDLKGMGPMWSGEEVERFFSAYHSQEGPPEGRDWHQIAEAVGTRSEAQCRAVFKLTSSFLSIPRAFQNEEALAAIIQDHYENSRADINHETSANDNGGEDGDEQATGTRQSVRRVAASAAGATHDGEDDTDEAVSAAGRRTVVPAHAPAVTRKGFRSNPRRARSASNTRALFAKMLGSDAGGAPQPPIRSPMSAPAKGRGTASAEKPSKRAPGTDLPTKRSRTSGMGKTNSRKRLFTVEENETSVEQPKRKQSKNSGAGGKVSRAKSRGVDATPDEEAVDMLLLLQLAGGSQADDAPTGSGDGPEYQSPRKSPEPTQPVPTSAQKSKSQSKKAGAAAARRPSAANAPSDSVSSVQRPDFSQQNMEEESKALVQPVPETPPPPPPPPRRRRKPVRERLPPSLSPMKGLAFSRRPLSATTSMMVAQVAGLDVSNALLRAKGLPLLNDPSLDARSLHPSERLLRRVLAQPRLRRWIRYEWFYSTQDRPWFMRNQLQEFLDHLGLNHRSMRALTRAEWNILRASLGRPRRLSLNFLREERAKLECYRQAVRARHAELPLGEQEGEPQELPRPLSVGQRVSGVHPVTRTIHDGTILTVDNNTCRVQFDQQQLGVELVNDLNLTPVNILDNLPPLLAQMYEVAGLTPPVGMGGAGNNLASLGTGATSAILKQANRQREARSGIFAGLDGSVVSYSATVEQALTGAALSGLEAAAIAKVASLLDKKEASLVQLRSMNQELQVSPERKSSHVFRHHYVSMLDQIKQFNAELESALANMRAHSASPIAAELAMRAVPALGSLETNQLGGEVAHSSDGPAAMHSALHASASSASCLRQAQSLLANMLQRGLREELSPEVRQAVSGDQEGNYLSSLLSGCVGLLFQVQHLSESCNNRATVDSALDRTAASLMPRCEANVGTYQQIQHHIAMLKEQLTSV